METSFSFLTENQIQIKEAFHKAATKQETVAIFDYPGSGFKYALNDYLIHPDHHYVKAAYAGVLNNAYQKSQLPIELSRQFLQIRFSNLNYKKTDARDLIRVLGQRVKRDLLGKRILLVFDNVDRLKTEAQLVRFMEVIRCINFKCGIVVRTTMNHLKKIEGMDEKVLADFLYLTKTRKVLPRNSQDDVEALCRVHGIKDNMIVEEIATSTKNFKIAMTKIGQYVGFEPPSQLSIPFI